MVEDDQYSPEGTADESMVSNNQSHPQGNGSASQQNVIITLEQWKIMAAAVEEEGNDYKVKYEAATQEVEGLRGSQRVSESMVEEIEGMKQLLAENDVTFNEHDVAGAARVAKMDATGGV